MATQDEARMQSMLQTLQMQDEMVEEVLVYSKFVVVYFLQQDQQNPGWRKANIEGPVYIYRRRTAPYFKLLVKHQSSSNDLVDNVHPQWELDCQKNYVFYKVEDPEEKIRGLWFHEDSERLRVEEIMKRVLKDLQNGPPRQAPPQAQVAPAPAAMGGDSVVVTRASLRAALRSLADDDAFVAKVVQKMKEQPYH
mmetsp:Transcript_60075/g.127263  ORF Transcript_60075/g.127263 Transcript_60075/m.127263 type:complete len:194 (-) Transcript_60075:83-664(-)